MRPACLRADEKGPQRPKGREIHVIPSNEEDRGFMDWVLFERVDQVLSVVLLISVHQAAGGRG